MSTSDSETNAEAESGSETAGSDAEQTDTVAEAPDDVALRTSGLTKFFGAIEAVRGVDIDVKSDEIFAIVGDNGAGKSTLIKMVSGVLRPTAGEIYLRQDGRLVRQYFSSSKDAIDAGIATVYQGQHLSPNASAMHNVFLGIEPLKRGPEGWLLRRVDEQRMAEVTRELLDDIGFDFDPRSPVNDLSGGQQQAVAVARALIRDPPIIILDEPTSEVSTGGTDKIVDLIRAIPDGEKSVILITHKIDIVVDVADRIGVMRDGELVEIFDTTQQEVDRMEVVQRMHGERRR
jgi:ABC-type sugar transport system ATPase subunit